MSTEENTAGKPRWLVPAVWVTRVLVGAVFIISGWAKSVDPWGFVYKVEEYLSVWSLGGVFPREIIVVGTVGLSIFEFVTGILLLTGSLRRTSPVFAAAMMAFLLPLTAYIAVADPVADCGCFGDLWVISNTATFVKNLVITALIVFLLIYNRRVGTGIIPGLQWIAIAISVIYALLLAFVGWQFQPVVDFRPYPVGSDINGGPAESDVTYIYERDDDRREFTLDALPDSTWTYIGPAQTHAFVEPLALFDGEDEVTEDVLMPDDETDGELLILVVSEPGLDFLTRARFANELCEYEAAYGGRMIAVVAASGDALDRWRDLARPKMPVYSSSDTSLKQLVRGSTALVRVNDGIITLKRNFATVVPDLLSRPAPIDSMKVFDDGHIARLLTLPYVGVILLLWLIGAWYNKKSDPVKTILRK
ncbi:MAG: DoxX family protein [Bacteroidales bacterium]|nr:DoxX family protein [Bacteroidales bacterium]